MANPESSPITYAYDETASTNGAGQLTSKSQLRGVDTQATATARFHYDSLGRMTSKVYTGAPDGIVTPAVTYTYDAHNPAIAGVTSYAKGRRTRVEVTGGVVTTIDSFDAMGRATRSSQGTYRFGSDSVAGYEYLRGGALSVMRLPTGRTLTYSFDDAGRPVGVGDGATAYVSSVGYTDFGAMSLLRMNGWLLRETRSYDSSRLQLTGIGLEKCTDGTVQCTTPSPVRSLGLVYTTAATGGNGSGPNNNGSVRQQTISDEGVLRATPVYGYDALDRLTTFTEGTLLETNCYDVHGNRAVLQRVGLSPLIPQVANCTGVGALFPGNRWASMPYDAAGGIGNDGRSLLRYDGEDRLVATKPVSGSTWAGYGYDGDGKRVWADGVTFVYDAFGKLAVEYGGTVTTSGREFVGVDHLGSTRAVVSGDGAVRRMDYWPFGTELSVVDTGWRVSSLGFGVDAKTRVKFTGQARDEGTGLDYFAARYYSGVGGRWVSPDLINLTNDRVVSPNSTLNKYAYAANNPLKFVDPDGNDITLFFRDAGNQAEFDLGHAFIAAHDSSSVEILDYVPHPNDSVSIRSAIPFDASSEGYTYSDSEILNNRSGGTYASLTIQTSPEVTAKVQAFIKEFRSAPPRYRYPVGHTCVTACRAALELAGIMVLALTPAGLWDSLYRRHSPAYRLLQSDGKSFQASSSYGYGADAGSPRGGDSLNFQKYLFRLLQAQLEAERNKKGYAGDFTITYK